MKTNAIQKSVGSRKREKLSIMLLLTLSKYSPNGFTAKSVSFNLAISEECPNEWLKGMDVRTVIFTVIFIASEFQSLEEAMGIG